MISDLPISGVGATSEHAKIIIDCYYKWTGKQLMDSNQPENIAKLLYYAPIIVLSHGTEAVPVLNYGNEAAQRLWEMDWDTFTKTPSRDTAEALERSEREQFLKKVHQNGYVDNYTGIRISSTGRRFYIENAIVWNLIDQAGEYYGQAAAFSEYRDC